MYVSAPLRILVVHTVTSFVYSLGVYVHFMDLVQQLDGAFVQAAEAEARATEAEARLDADLRKKEEEVRVLKDATRRLQAAASGRGAKRMVRRRVQDRRP